MFQKQEPTSVRTLNQKAGTPSPLTQMFEFAEWWGGSGDLESVATLRPGVQIKETTRGRFDSKDRNSRWAGTSTRRSLLPRVSRQAGPGRRGVRGVRGVPGREKPDQPDLWNVRRNLHKKSGRPSRIGGRGGAGRLSGARPWGASRRSAAC